MLRPGIVWTDKELKSQFGLTAEADRLLPRVPQGDRPSITQLAISDMVRYAGHDADFVRDAVLEDAHDHGRGRLLVEQIDQMIKDDPQRADVLNATAQQDPREADRGARSKPRATPR
jgi:hypothetical protein